VAGSRVSGPALGSVFAGSLLAYAGITGKSVPHALQAIISGKSPATVKPSRQISGTPAAPGTPGGGLLSFGGGGTGLPSGTAGGGGAPSANKAIGALLAAARGWGPGTADWAYLESGWQEESGWSATASNGGTGPDSGSAYGIPQAFPGSKMASAGADWRTSASTQIRWGLGYIAAAYGRPSQVPGWSPNGPLPGYAGY
jgi:hypothetical protein